MHITTDDSSTSVLLFLVFLRQFTHFSHTMYTDVSASNCTPKESAMKVDAGREIPWNTGSLACANSVPDPVLN